MNPRSEFRQVRLRLVCALPFLAAVGCTTTSAIHPGQLTRLDGYEARWTGAARPELETLAGTKVKFDSASALHLDLPSERVGARFDSIQVHDGVFAGRTVTGREIQTPLDQIKAAQVDEPNVGASLAVAAAIVLALGVTGFMLSGSNDGNQPVPGRPLRVAGKMVAAPLATPLATADGWRATDRGPDTSALSPAARRILAADWTDNACTEHASVPAFSRLSLTLMAMGAPAHLVKACHRAALEEIEHARLAFALAEAYAGKPRSPGALAELRNAPAITATSLQELASESLLDGCVNEGAAAAIARLAYARARDPVVREALAVIARDESSHAELAWAVVAWCLEQGGVEIGRALRKVVHRAPLSLASNEAPPDMTSELAAHGWVDPGERRDLLRQTEIEVASRLAHLIRQPGPAPSDGTQSAN
jgi:hypothetical protein